MRLKPGMTKDATQAVLSFLDYQTQCTGRIGHVVRKFCRERPHETEILVEMYDSTHSGLNQLPARKLARTTTKVRSAVEDAREDEVLWHRWIQWVRRHRLVFSVVIPLLILPMLVCPTHPVAVYGYLIDLYHPSPMSEAYAYSGADQLPKFVTSPSQVQRYKADLREDMLDQRTGKVFVIVRCPNGDLRQESIRTWNGFLPAGLPPSINRRLDRKELPYLGDEVETWLQGNEIIAMGHYHAFGGPPSNGDTHAQIFSDIPEIVVVNGLVPMVYLDGEIVSYGNEVFVTEEVARSLRAFESVVTTNVTWSVSCSKEINHGVRSFLGFLQHYRNIDISRKDQIAEGIDELCAEFKDEYRTVFTNGFSPTAYENDPDRYNFLWRLGSLYYWARVHGSSLPSAAN